MSHRHPPPRLPLVPAIAPLNTAPQRSDETPPTAKARCFWNALAVLLPLAVSAWLLRQPLSTLGEGLWGPASPWANGDFIGNLWCWWRGAEALHGGREWMDSLGWPEGGDLLLFSFPNRLDAWLIAPFYDADHLLGWWNGLAVFNLAASIAALVVAARLAGASPLSAASGATLLLYSPVVLHELAGGRMATFIFWPGLLALGTFSRALASGRPGKTMAWAVATGVLLAVQTFAYAYHAAAVALLLLPPTLLTARPWRTRGLALGTSALVALVIAGPYLATLLEMAPLLAQVPPPAGYTSLPVAGALGLDLVPDRFRLHALVLPVALALLVPRASRAWGLAALLGLALALGPYPRWDLNQILFHTPLAARQDLLPALTRMHHPIRAVPMALGALGVGLGLALDACWRTRQKWAVPLYALVVAALWASGWPMARAMRQCTSWAIPEQPPGLSAARFLGRQGEEPIIDVFGGTHITGLSLQPWHHRPLLETAQGYQPPPTHRWSPDTRRLVEGTTALAAGEDPGSAWFKQVREAGFGALLLVERPTLDDSASTLARTTAILLGRCGRPAYADLDSRIFTTAACWPAQDQAQPVIKDPEPSAYPD